MESPQVPSQFQKLQILWLVLLMAFFGSAAIAQTCGEDECSQNSANALMCQDQGGIWNSVTCSCRNMSPIIISLSRDGYDLTSAADGVAFDLNADGILDQIAWTSTHSDDAFLVLDRNSNGRIDDGKELFGNITDQPPSSQRNGFFALAVFDRAENGGNGDGIIDEHDAIYSLLRLWRDSNHNGISEANELSTLPASGVSSISLDFKSSLRVDRNGNIFRYRSRVNERMHSSVAFWAYDGIFGGA